jgi:hypothetical protein
VKVRLAGVGSALPSASVARTSKVWVPSASVAEVKGVVQSRTPRVEAALERRVRLGRGEGEGRGVVVGGAALSRTAV